MEDLASLFHTPHSVEGGLYLYHQRTGQRFGSGLVVDTSLSVFSGKAGYRGNLLVLGAARILEQVNDSYEPRIVRVVLPAVQGERYQGSVLLAEQNLVEGHKTPVKHAIFEKVSPFQNTRGEITQQLGRFVLPRLMEALSGTNLILNGGHRGAQTAFTHTNRAPEITVGENVVPGDILMRVCGAVLRNDYEDRFRLRE